MKNERLYSLDLLRGLDMLLLTAVGPLVYELHRWLGFSDGFMRQFSHYWGVFTLWDIIMPLFIFMCGAAVPLALTKRLEEGTDKSVRSPRGQGGTDKSVRSPMGHAGWRYWRHVFGRVALLWFFGLICQGHLLDFDPLTFSPYTNTLQAIAAGYLIAAVVLLIPSRKIQAAMPIALAAVYGILLAVWGDYSKEGNLAQLVEMKFLRTVLPAGSKMIATWGYTWVLTSLMFGAMTLCGSEATRILTAAAEPWTKAKRLAILGGSLLVAGYALAPVVPPIKHIYTVSFTSQAMGYSVLALCVLYVVADIWKIRRGWWLVLLYGQTALAAYLLAGAFGSGTDAWAGTLTHGLAKYTGGAYKVILVAVRIGIVVWLLSCWRRLKSCR